MKKPKRCGKGLTPISRHAFSFSVERESFGFEGLLPPASIVPSRSLAHWNLSSPVCHDKRAQHSEILIPASLIVLYKRSVKEKSRWMALLAR